MANACILSGKAQPRFFRKGFSLNFAVILRCAIPNSATLPVRGGEGEILQAARRRGLGEHLQQVRPDESVRRLQGKRVWT